MFYSQTDPKPQIKQPWPPWKAGCVFHWVDLVAIYSEKGFGESVVYIWHTAIALSPCIGGVNAP